MVLQDHAELGMGERSNCMPRQGCDTQEQSGKKGLGTRGWPGCVTGHTGQKHRLWGLSSGASWL